MISDEQGNLAWVLLLAGAGTMFANACSSDGENASEAVEASMSLALNASPTELGCQPGRDGHSATSTTRGSTGRVEISDFFIGGVFYADNLIIRARAQPQCVAHMQLPEQSFSAAGALAVSSEFVGKPGGPVTPFTINPDSSNEYFEFPDPPLFNLGAGEKVQVALAGAAGFPPIHAAALRSSAFSPIHVTTPVLPASQTLAVSSVAGLEFAWDAPAMSSRPVGKHRPGESVSVRFFALGPVHWGQLFCSWPTAAGHGEVPVSLLREFRRQLGGIGRLDANIDMYSGDLREFTTSSSSYVVFATTAFATTFPRSTFATFE